MPSLMPSSKPSAVLSSLQLKAMNLQSSVLSLLVTLHRLNLFTKTVTSQLYQRELLLLVLVKTSVQYLVLGSALESASAAGASPRKSNSAEIVYNNMEDWSNLEFLQWSPTLCRYIASVNLDRIAGYLTSDTNVVVKSFLLE
eukprot:14407840-Ditylum_brightwellii.AAC.1